jgi:PAS domain S-box-containing protein
MGSQTRTTILLVEDDPGVARLEQLRLERAGYTVATAATAEAGLQKVADGGIELIVLDQQLSAGTSGLEFFRQVKAAGFNVPAILVTGMQEENLLVEALRAGVRDFVPKTQNFLNHLEPIVTRVLDQVRTERELAESRVVARENAERRRELEHEVAQRKRVEQALREAEEYLRLMVESVKDVAIFTIDPRGRIVSWNPGAQQLFGYAEHEILGQSLAVLYIPEDRAGGVPEREVAVAAARGGSADERWHLRKDDSRFFASGVLNPIFDEENRLRGFTKIARDVTADKRAGAERMRLLAELEAERALLNTLLDNAPVGFGFFDHALRFLRLNPALAEFDGLPIEAHLGRTLLDVLPNISPDVIEAFRYVLQTGRSIVNKEFRGETPKRPGQPRCWLGNFYPVKTPDGIMLGAGAVVTDINDRKCMEEALREADRRKDQFLAMLAHELRNPLAPISNAVQIMKVEGPNGPNFQWSVKVIQDQIKHMTRMVDDLLDVSRITRGKVVLQKERVELEVLVALAVEASRPLIEDCNHHLTVTLPPHPVLLEVDSARMAQVLSNLLNNAAKYTDEGGAISLTAEQSGHEVVIHVRDNGIGIPPELLPHVFEIFTQADQTLSRSRGGLGIGLTLVRSLVEMHNGRVAVRSDGPDRGSEFVVRLPVAAGAPDPPDGERPATEDHEPRLPRRRILVVDDNCNNATSLGVLLRDLGQDVDTAYDGLTALDLARRHRPDVVLLDIGLPGMDGYEVARRCRAEKDLARTMLVAMTGYGKDEDRRRSQEAGFNVHLVKPVNLEDVWMLLNQPALHDPRS